MQTKQLGNSELNITPIGFGAWAIGGGGWAFGWGEQNDQESIAAINCALDLGVNWIDTAAVYAPVTSLQPPYSLVKRDVEKEILPFCQENNIGVIVYSPMQSGLLTGKMTPERVANFPDND